MAIKSSIYSMSLALYKYLTKKICEKTEPCLLQILMRFNGVKTHRK